MTGAKISDAADQLFAAKPELFSPNQVIHLRKSLPTPVRTSGSSKRTLVTFVSPNLSHVQVSEELYLEAKVLGLAELLQAKDMVWSDKICRVLILHE